jgi:hypothetical protein
MSRVRKPGKPQSRPSPKSSLPKKIIVEFRVTERGAWCTVDLDAIREHYDECVSNGANPHLEKIPFGEYISALPAFRAKDIHQFSGKHFIFGEIESLKSDPNLWYFVSSGMRSEKDELMILVRWEV